MHDGRGERDPGRSEGVRRRNLDLEKPAAICFPGEKREVISLAVRKRGKENLVQTSEELCVCAAIGPQEAWFGKLLAKEAAAGIHVPS